MKKSKLVPRIFDDKGDLRKTAIPLEKLSYSDFQFIEAWKNHNFDAALAGKELGLSESQWTYRKKRLAWVEQEFNIRKAKTAMLSPEYVISKDIENLEKSIRLEDTDHKSLDRLAKVQGLFKTSEVNITQNNFQMPNLSPEGLLELKALGDRLASIDTTAENAV